MQDALDLRRLLSPLLRNWPWILCFVLSAMATALALTYVYSERYEATALLSFRPVAAPDANPALPQAFGSPVPAAPLKVVGHTLLELARAPDLLEQLVNEFDLDAERSKQYAPGLMGLVGRLKDGLRDALGDLMALAKYGRIPESDPRLQAMQKLASNISVRSYDAYVFRVQVEDISPIRAAAIADIVAQALVERSRDGDRRPGVLEREQLAALLADKRAELTEARAELRGALTAGDAASVELETQQLLERRTLLKLERSRLNADVKKARQRLEVLTAKAALKRDLTTGGEIRSPVGSATISPDDFKRLESEKLTAEVELKALEAQYAALDGSVSEVEQRIRGMPALQARVDGLRMQLRLLERDVELLSGAYQDAMIRSTNLGSEVTLFARALVPVEPTSPIKLYHVGLTGFLAVFVAIGATYVLAFLADERRAVLRLTSNAQSVALPMAPGPNARIGVDHDDGPG